jgi:rhodanese-related sulfurtransferase
MVDTITRDALKAKLDAGEPVTIVEALPEKYYRHAHLPGALHLPHDEVDALAPGLLPDRDAAIVVYCANDTCKNSDIAARRLAELGYTRVSAYVGGKKDWIDASLPVVREQAAAA